MSSVFYTSSISGRSSSIPPYWELFIGIHPEAPSQAKSGDIASVRDQVGGIIGGIDSIVQVQASS